MSCFCIVPLLINGRSRPACLAWVRGPAAAKRGAFGLDRVEDEEVGGPDRNRTDVRGFAVRCIATLPPGLGVSRSGACHRPGAALGQQRSHLGLFAFVPMGI